MPGTFIDCLFFWVPAKTRRLYVVIVVDHGQSLAWCIHVRDILTTWTMHDSFYLPSLPTAVLKSPIIRPISGESRAAFWCIKNKLFLSHITWDI